MIALLLVGGICLAAYLYALVVGIRIGADFDRQVNEALDSVLNRDDDGEDSWHG